MAPLESGVPFEVVEDKEVWHPIWEGKINNKVNALFIKAAVDCIWDNEEVSVYVLLGGYVLIFGIENSESSRWERRNRRR
jgi:hypothetical protein